jgi:group I intron endonuclease
MLQINSIIIHFILDIEKMYDNSEINKLSILHENKNKAGVYQWTHKESGKFYIGSAVDISKRLKNYYNKSYLNRYKNMHICNALLIHGYSSFSLTIIKYIDISNSSSNEVRKLILEREQYYLNTMKPVYNILKVAGSILGYVHNEKSIAKISEAKKGKPRSAETRTLLSDANIGKTLHSETKSKISDTMKGMIRSAETRTRMSEAKKGKIISVETRIKMSEAKKGKFLTAETRHKISTRRGTVIYVYSGDNNFFISFTSARMAGKYFNCNHSTITTYLNSGKLFLGKWILSTFN